MAVAMAVSTLMAIWIMSFQVSFFMVHASFLPSYPLLPSPLPPSGSGVGRSALRMLSASDV